MMKHSKTETLRRAYRAYKNSPYRCLPDCYRNCSAQKERAYENCIRKEIEYSGFNGRIIGFNSQIFSFGFIGEINEKEAFFYITPTYERYIYISEI